jgi:hypothetical protein
MIKRDETPVKRGRTVVKRDGTTVKRGRTPVKRDGTGVNRVGTAVKRDGTPVKRDGAAINPPTSARQRCSFIDSESSDQFFMRDRLTRAGLAARRRQTTVEVVVVGLVVKGSACERILQRNSRLAQRPQHPRGASQFLFRERINDFVKHFACSHDPSPSENSLGRSR